MDCPRTNLLSQSYLCRWAMHAQGRVEQKLLSRMATISPFSKKLHSKSRGNHMHTVLRPSQPFEGCEAQSMNGMSLARHNGTTGKLHR